MGRLVQLVSLNKVLTVSMIQKEHSNVKLISLDFSLEEGPISATGQIKQSLDSFYVTDSPLSVTNIAEMQCFI